MAGHTRARNLMKRDLGWLFWGAARRFASDIRDHGGDIEIVESPGLLTRSFVFAGDAKSLRLMNRNIDDMQEECRALARRIFPF